MGTKTTFKELFFSNLGRTLPWKKRVYFLTKVWWVLNG